MANRHIHVQKSPMAAISLYCAATVYIYQCSETQSARNVDNLDFIIAAMDAIGREHVITRAFLKQVVLDIERNNITQIAHLPRLDNLPHVIDVSNHNIPLLARSKFSRHSEMQPPLPGRLPLGQPRGNVRGNKMKDCGIGFNYGIQDNSISAITDDGGGDDPSPLLDSPDAFGQRVPEANGSPPWLQTGTVNQPSGSTTNPEPGMTATAQPQQSRVQSIPRPHQAHQSSSTPASSSSSASFVPPQTQRPPPDPAVQGSWMHLASQGRFAATCELPHRTTPPATTPPGGAGSGGSSNISAALPGGAPGPGLQGSTSAVPPGPAPLPTTQRGVTLGDTILPRRDGTRGQGPGIRIAGRGIGPNGMNSWDQAGLCMYTAFMRGATTEGTGVGGEGGGQQRQHQQQQHQQHQHQHVGGFEVDPWGMAAGSAQDPQQATVDWEALAAAAGIDVPGSATGRP